MKCEDSCDKSAAHSKASGERCVSIGETTCMRERLSYKTLLARVTFFCFLGYVSISYTCACKSARIGD